MHELRILPRPDQATPRQVRIGTVAVAVWTAIWIAAAALIAWYVSDLGRWSDLSRSTAGSLQRGAAVLAPLLGHHGPVADLQDLSRQARSSAAAARQSVRQTAYLLGLAVGLIPTVPALGLYVQFRRSRRKELHSLQAAVRDPSRRASVVRFLAERTVDERALPGLLRASGPADASQATPPGAGREEAMLRLARAEASRLGLPREFITSLQPDAPG